MPLHRRIPKRGFHNPFRIEYEVVNLDTLGERLMPARSSDQRRSSPLVLHHRQQPVSRCWRAVR